MVLHVVPFLSYQQKIQQDYVETLVYEQDQPMSLQRVAIFLKKGGQKDVTAFVVRTVTDDIRLLQYRKSSSTYHQYCKVLTFDQLDLKSPTGKKTLLIQGKHTACEAHFSLPHSPICPLQGAQIRMYSKCIYLKLTSQKCSAKKTKRTPNLVSKGSFQRSTKCLEYKKDTNLIDIDPERIRL
uniref:Large ribosomal subunit protein eL18 n=1 Tax=Megaselia scalaris TaxID=36166 RepID=T1H3Y2_MEGSC